MDHRFVLVRVEWLTERLDLRNAFGFNDAAQLALRQPHALDPGVVRIGREVLDGSVEIVEDAQQLADQDRVAELGQRGALLIGPSLVVRKVGRRAMPVVAVFRVTGSRVAELALELLDSLGQLDPRRSRNGVGTLFSASLGGTDARTAVRGMVGHCVSP